MQGRTWERLCRSPSCRRWEADFSRDGEIQVLKVELRALQRLLQVPVSGPCLGLLQAPCSAMPHQLAFQVSALFS